MDIRCKRAYEDPATDDGYRVLVDRVWPRGVSKDDLELDAWLTDLAPSTALRKWFNHDPGRWDEFRERYFAELETRRDDVDDLVERIGDRRLTLVYGAKDVQHNQAVVLREYLYQRVD